MMLPAMDVVQDIFHKANEKMLIADELFHLKHYDDAVSRAYYCIFHCMSAVLLTRGLHFSSHKEVISSFNKEFIKTGIVSGITFRQIESLFTNRQISDYEVKKYIDEVVAKENIEYARNILNECKRYCSTLYLNEIK